MAEDLNSMTPAARSAAMRKGMTGWGVIGGLNHHVRYMEARQKRAGRQPKCCCGCGTAKTHVGKANGVCLMSGCELCVRRWVKQGERLNG